MQTMLSCASSLLRSPAEKCGWKLYIFVHGPLIKEGSTRCSAASTHSVKPNSVSVVSLLQNFELFELHLAHHTNLFGADNYRREDLERKLKLVETQPSNLETMTKPLTYVDFVAYRSNRNPCLKPLVDLLKNGHKSTTIRTKPNFFWIDFAKTHLDGVPNTPTTLEAVVRDILQLKQRVKSPPSAAAPDFRRILIVEDIDVDSITQIGSNLDVDPMFFAHYMLTDFGDIEKAPAPASSSLVPSSFVERDSIHIHYQQMIEITAQNQMTPGIYKYKSPGNVPRAVRCLPSLSGGVQPAIMRGCCSAILKRFEPGSWLCWYPSIITYPTVPFPKISD